MGREVSQVQKKLWNQAVNCRIPEHGKMNRDQKSGWVLVSEISLMGKGTEVGQLHKECSYSLSRFISNSHLLFSSLSDIPQCTTSKEKNTGCSTIKVLGRLILCLSTGMAAMVRIPVVETGLERYSWEGRAKENSYYFKMWKHSKDFLLAWSEPQKTAFLSNINFHNLAKK